LTYISNFSGLRPSEFRGIAEPYKPTPPAVWIVSAATLIITITVTKLLSQIGKTKEDKSKQIGGSL